MSQPFVSKMAKVGLAAHLQVQQDNQRTLDHQAAVRKARSQQHLKLTEAQMNQLVGNNGTPKSADLEPDDMGNILIDSPTNNYYPGQSAASPAAPSLLSKAAPYIATAVLAAGAGGLGSWLAKPSSTTPPAPVVTSTSTASGFTLDLGDKK